MHLTISHITEYIYDTPAPYGLQQLRLTPRSQPGQDVLNWTTDVEGGRQEAAFEDHHGNRVLLIGLESGRAKISVHSRGDVETSNLSGVLGQHDGRAPLWLYRRETKLTAPGAGVRAIAAKVANDTESDINRLHRLCSHILETVRYDVNGTDSKTTAEAAISIGHGVCQDHANVFVSAARLLGFPSRYVSGYLLMRDRVEQEASHAWAESYVSDLGWVGFDVSNGISPDDCYVRIATGLDSAEAAPIAGVMLGHSAEAMNVTLQVQQQ